MSTGEVPNISYLSFPSGEQEKQLWTVPILYIRSCEDAELIVSSVLNPWLLQLSAADPCKTSHATSYSHY